MNFDRAHLDRVDNVHGGIRLKTKVGHEGHFEGMSASKISNYLLGVSTGSWYDSEEEDDFHDDRFELWDDEAFEDEEDDDYYNNLIADVTSLRDKAEIKEEDEETEHKRMLDWRKKSMGDRFERNDVVDSEPMDHGVSLKESREILRRQHYSEQSEPAVPKKSTVMAEYSTRCAICQEDFEADSPITTVKTCGHRFCKECLSEYIAYKAEDVSCLYHHVTFIQREKGRVMSIFDHNAYGIPCPGHLCTHVMLIDELVPATSYGTISRFVRFSQVHRANYQEQQERLAAIPPDQSIKHCPRCTKPQKMRRILYGRLRCSVCSTVLCGTCIEQHPRAISCDASLPNLVLNGTRVNRCPACRIPIIKDGGCNHMTCVMCSTEFCNLCGMRSKSGDTSHWHQGVFADTCLGLRKGKKVRGKMVY